MKAAVLRGGDIVVADVPAPVPAAGQVLVKTLCCGICGSDLHYAKHAPHMVELSKRIPGRVSRSTCRATSCSATSSAARCWITVPAPSAS